MKTLVLEAGTIRRPFVYREHTTDQSVVQQMFVRKHYDLQKLRRAGEFQAYLSRLQRRGQRPLIVDLGANIGASSVFFALTYPQARIVAVEPDPGNFAVLMENARGLDIRCCQAAVSSEEGTTRLLDAGIGEWGFRTDPTGSGAEVPRLAVSRILADEGSFAPFVAKIDIEGGEQDLFQANTEWVSRFPLVVIELHDWLLPKQGTALPFLRCVAALQRDFVHVGENIFSMAYALP